MKSLLNVLYLFFGMCDICDTEHIADVSSTACFTESCSYSTNVSQQVEIT